ncbi:MAG: hypothetical protein ACRYFS_24425 [Janthinobacterium lividum]
MTEIIYRSHMGYLHRISVKGAEAMEFLTTLTAFGCDIVSVIVCHQ